MKLFLATVFAVVAVSSVGCLRQYPRRSAEQAERERYFRDFDSSLEPPRPEEFEFFKSASEPKSTKERKEHKEGGGGDFFGDEHYLSFFEPPQEKKRPPKSGGKSRYHSETKQIPEVKPIFDASEQLEQRESQKQPKKSEEATEDDNGIKCVKVDTKPVTADDVYKGRFRRDAKTMTCYKCEDMRKGGTYQKCSYGTNPDNKAFFVSHEKSVRSNEKPKNFKFGPDRDEEEDEKSAESRFRSFFEPSDEFQQASASIGKYVYDDGTFSSSNANYRYEIPESSYALSRIPEDKPNGDHYLPSPSYFQALKKSPEEKFHGKDAPQEKSPSNHRYSSYGEKESSKGKKGSSEESSGEEADRSGSPSEYSYKSDGGGSGEDEAGSDEHHEGRPSEYSFSSSKKEPTKSYSYYTTDPPVNFYYETNDKEGAPSQQKPSNANEFSYSSSKKQPTKLYSYETTDKPVGYAYKTESKTKPKSTNVPAYDYYTPSEYQFSKTVEDPPEEFYESSSYDSADDDKPAQENAPQPRTVEAPKSSRRQHQEQEHQPSRQGKKTQNAPQVREFSTTYKDLPDTFVAQPSEELKKALGEFHQKDRSNCTKVSRDKMTCWQCIDHTGAKHEECMYVASSEPKAYQTAYVEQKQSGKPAAAGGKKAKAAAAVAVAAPAAEASTAVDQKQARQQRRRPKNTAQQQQQSSASTATETRTRGRRPVAAATSTTEYSRVAPATPRSAEPAPSASGRGESRRRKPKREEASATPSTSEERPKSNRARDERRRRRPEEPKAAEPTEQKETRQKKPVEDDKPPPPKPQEFEVAGPEGAFSEETRLRFDKRLGMSLPEYMLEKSVFEEDFDRFVQSG